MTAVITGEETRLEDFIARKIRSCQAMSSLSIIHGEIAIRFIGWQLDYDAAQHLLILLQERMTLLMQEYRQDVEAEG